MNERLREPRPVFVAFNVAYTHPHFGPNARRRSHRINSMSCVPSLRVAFCLLGGLAAMASTARADLPFLHPLFSDHMVLQRGIENPVWGWTQPGAKVTVTLQGKTVEATAGADGKWMAKLPPLVYGGPFQMDVGGPQRASVKDVLIGEVWVCSGQSNMEWPVAASNEPEKEIKEANHPRLRLYTVPKRISGEPQVTLEAKWQNCTPETIGSFSAVGYFFGRELLKQLDCPVGLIHSSWGGTIAEAWVSGEALQTMDDFKGAVDATKQQFAAQQNGADFDQQFVKWWADNDPGSKEGASWAAVEVPADGWQAMALPTTWETAGLPDFDGIVWFRRVVEIPAELAGKMATLELGNIDDRDDTYLNGQRIGGMEVWNAGRKYDIGAGALQAGKNVLAVRVLDTGGGGGIYGPAEAMRLVVPAQDGVPAEVVLPLTGEWQYRVGTALGSLPPFPQRIGNNPNQVTVLYNGMIAPLLPYGVKGAIWYQGESNAGRALQYRALLPTLIGDWRTRFAAPDFSFHIVQLANFMEVQTTPVQNGWAEIRESQALTAKNDPKVGLAVITDIGDAADIHPRNKQDVGKRLALQALAITYGRPNVVSEGPQFAELKVEGGKAIVKFTSVGGGLKANGGELKGFAIAGADKNFVWGKAEINGDSVIVSAAEVAEPVAVRYNWANNPIGNLFNAEKLPAAPFRTDRE
jgi:sialate O-acetylesterase